jgi:purine nucleosidase
MEFCLKGRGSIGDYLLEIFREYGKDHYAWSKVLWDMTAVAWLIDGNWTLLNLIHSPIVTDQYTLSFNESRHFIWAAYHIRRDSILADFFHNIEDAAK